MMQSAARWRWRSWWCPPAGGVTADELHAHVRQRLAGYKTPKHWVVREQALPRTASGKVAKPVLRTDLPALMAASAAEPTLAASR